MLDAIYAARRDLDLYPDELEFRAPPALIIYLIKQASPLFGEDDRLTKRWRLCGVEVIPEVREGWQLLSRKTGRQLASGD